MQITHVIRQASDAELAAAITAAELALPDLADPAIRQFTEMTIIAMTAEAYNRAELAGDHQAALEVLQRFTEPVTASRPVTEPRRRAGRGKAPARRSVRPPGPAAGVPS